MMYEQGGVSIIRDRSVLLIGQKSLLSKVDVAVIERVKNEYFIIKDLMSKLIDSSHDDIAQSLENTRKILLGTNPFGADIQLY